MKPARALILSCLLPASAWAEEPLSAIEWLKEPAPITVAQPLIQPIGELDASSGAQVPDVDVMPLDSTRPDAVGLLPSSSTGLPASLWQASSTNAIVSRLEKLPDRPLPAVQALYYTLLLAEADPPEDAATNARFLHARIEALRNYGAVDAAFALVERAGPATPILFNDWMNLSLLLGTEDAACEALSNTPDLSDDYSNRVYCLVRTGDWPTAALTFDTARATGLLEPHEINALAVFIDPEFGEASDELPATRDVTPLLFRLHEANGTPLQTRALPREFAVADLRGTMGWRAEIEAAERLARTGALPANRLLGLYTSRKPAASGGVWDRVRHIQTFDRAMLSGDTERIANALPEVWEDMREAGLGVVFATLYGERLAHLSLSEHEDIIHAIGLLSPIYETLAAKPGHQTRMARFLEGVARGTPDLALAQGPAEEAIAAAFAATVPARKYAGALSEGHLGQVILDAAAGLDGASANNRGYIEVGLATLRFVGLEDVARRTALQILLLPPQ